jgi:hypothetical protein
LGERLNIVVEKLEGSAMHKQFTSTPKQVPFRAQEPTPPARPLARRCLSARELDAQVLYIVILKIKLEIIDISTHMRCT